MKTTQKIYQLKEEQGHNLYIILHGDQYESKLRKK